MFSILEKFVKLVFWFLPWLDKYVENKVLTIPLAFLTLALIVSVVVWCYKRFFKNRKYNPDIYWIIAIGSVLAVLSLFLYFYIDRTDKVIPFWSAVVSTVKIFTFGYDWRELTEILVTDPNNDLDYDVLVYRFLVVASTFAPILTARAVMAAFGENLAIIRSKITIFCRLHIFSELNEKSICLAEDIYRERGLPVKIIFANTNKEDMTDEKNDIISRVKRINALTSKKSVIDLSKRFFRVRKTKYYLISEDETHNVENCISLFDEIKEKGEEIYVFSMLDSTEIFIDSIDKKKKGGNKKHNEKSHVDMEDVVSEIEEITNGQNAVESEIEEVTSEVSEDKTENDPNEKRYKTKITLINEAKMTTYNLLLKHPLYAGADKLRKKEIFVTVIGGSKTAREFIKAALWCGQMKSFTFKMRIIESGELEEEFERSYGDLKGKAEKAGIKLNYKFIKADLRSKELANILAQQCFDANYFLVSTDDDELTMNISEMVRIGMSRKKKREEQPIIVPIIGNMDFYQIAKNFEAASDDIEYYPSGCYCDIYKKKHITNNPIVRLSRVFNVFYNIKSICDKVDEKTQANSANTLEPNNGSSSTNETFFEICEKSEPDFFHFLENSDNKKIGEILKNIVLVYNQLCVCGAIKKPKTGTHAKIIPTFKCFKIIKEVLDDFDEKLEVDKQSNMASVIHIFYKLRDVNLEVVSEKNTDGFWFKYFKPKEDDFETDFKEVTSDKKRVSKDQIKEIIEEEQTIRKLTEIEHNRWVVFQLMGGWEHGDVEDIMKFTTGKKKHKDEARKLHACIVEYSELEKIATDVYSDEYYFLRNDYIPIRLIKVALLECLNCEKNPLSTLFGFRPIIKARFVEQYAQKVDFSNQEIISDDIKKTKKTDTVNV